MIEISERVSSSTFLAILRSSFPHCDNFSTIVWQWIVCRLVIFPAHIFTNIPFVGIWDTRTSHHSVSYQSKAPQKSACCKKVLLDNTKLALENDPKTSDNLSIPWSWHIAASRREASSCKCVAKCETPGNNEKRKIARSRASQESPSTAAATCWIWWSASSGCFAFATLWRRCTLT